MRLKNALKALLPQAYRQIRHEFEYRDPENLLF